MSGYTKGPWFYGDEDSLLGVDYVEVHAGEYCCETFRSVAHVEASFDGERHLDLCDETRANARLISAAPELLEACVELTEAAKQGRGVTASHLNKVLDAIAKAKGATS